MFNQSPHDVLDGWDLVVAWVRGMASLFMMFCGAILLVYTLVYVVEYIWSFLHYAFPE